VGAPSGGSRSSERAPEQRVSRLRPEDTRPTRTTGEGLESERSPREQRAVHRGNAVVLQRTLGRETPEVEATFEERAGFGRCAGRKRANHERGGTCGERACKGAVTVSPWSGGEGSEGSGARRGMSDIGGSRWSAGNRVNPMVGSGMQQAHKVVCGRNRRGREKRRGRHCGGGWQPLHPLFGAGSRTQTADVDGGAVFEGTS